MSCSQHHLFNDFNRLIRPMQGWCSVEKALGLYDLVMAERPRLCVELGVFGGRSILPVAVALQELDHSPPPHKGLAIGIDPWTADAACEGFQGDTDNEKANRKWWAELDIEAIFRGALDALQPYAGYCALLRATSSDAANIFGRETIDLLHIDGNHSPVISCRDVVEWTPLLRPGGVLVFDDMDWPETVQAQELLAKRFTLEEHNGTWAVYRVPG